jgi:polar amino acid transport system substrate-binding protein
MKLKIFIFFSGALLVSTAFAKELAVKSDPWCPFSCESGEASKAPGFIVELLQESLKKQGVTVKYENMNWARAVDETEKGKNDSLAGCGPDDGDFILPKSHQTIAQFSLYGLSEASSFESYDKLAPRSVGIITGYTYDKKTQALIDSGAPQFIKVTGEDPLMNLLDLLKKKRIQYLYEEDQVFNHYVKSKLPKEKNLFKKIFSDSQAQQKLYVCFSKKNPDSQKYADHLSKSMESKDFKKTLQRLKKKYEISN